MIEFDFPKKEETIIKVIGVGGGGGNAVAHMFSKGIEGVDFAICNTDNQALNASSVISKIQLGPHLTEGRGAGTKPEVGKQACIESIDDIKSFLTPSTKMLFITAGLGGGTGTGAAPIIAKASKEMGVLTVGIVTLPFQFEGLRRKRQAIAGLEELKNEVDAILIISNDKLRESFGNLSISEAFEEADNILMTAAKGIAEIITIPGYINVDFADVDTVMRDSGVAIMGSAVASGEGRARKAISAAINSPLLEDNDIRGAQHILLNITSGTSEVTMDEIGEITEYVQEEAGYGTDLVWGNCIDPSLEEKICVTLIATGFAERDYKEIIPEKEKIIVPLDDRFLLNEEKGVAMGFVEGESTKVVDLDVDERRLKPLNMNAYEKYNDKDPYTELEERNPSEKLKNTEMEAARRHYLRENTSKPLDSPKTINDLENVPAYKRRNVVLDNVEQGEDRILSKYTVSMDEDNPLKRNNQFLHDNVD